MPAPRTQPLYSIATLWEMLCSHDESRVVAGLEAIPREVEWRERKLLASLVTQAGQHETARVRAAVARVCGYLQWPQLAEVVLTLLRDPQWVVRANAARALLKFPDFHLLLAEALE